MKNVLLAIFLFVVERDLESPRSDLVGMDVVWKVIADKSGATVHLH